MVHKSNLILFAELVNEIGLPADDEFVKCIPELQHRCLVKMPLVLFSAYLEHGVSDGSRRSRGGFRHLQDLDIPRFYCLGNLRVIKL